MSTQVTRRIRRQLLIRAGALAAVCWFISAASAQSSNIEVRLLPESNRVAVEVIGAPVSSWSFLDSYAGIVGLGRRIDRFAAFDERGIEMPVLQPAPGQFKSVNPAKRIRYEIDLRPVSRAADFAHVSWLDQDRGVLMPLDFLPLETAAPGSEDRSIHFDLSSPWAVHSNEMTSAPDRFVIHDVSRAVFAVAKNLRVSHTNASGLTLNFATNGEWAFNDADAVQLGQQVLAAYRQTFGSFTGKTATLVLFQFPVAVSASQWSAETRGSTVTLLMGKLPSKVGALAQLSTPLTHEFFHLWIPNALSLQGNYAWFYEGFTIYQASQTAVRLGFLTFPEFLNSIARAYDSSKNEADWSLIEASNRRFTSGLNSVYAKSQVVAFLYDLRLRSATHNKRSLADVYRKLTGGSFGAGGDGNEVVERVLSEEAGSNDFAHTFVQNPVSLNLANELAPFGLIVDARGVRTQISVAEKLSKPQRDLLRELGYNAATHATR